MKDQPTFITSTTLILLMLVGCGPSTEDLEAVDYTPLPGDDWEVSTPAEQGLDPMLVAELIGHGRPQGRFVPFGMFHYPRGDNNERRRYPISKSKEES